MLLLAAINLHTESELVFQVPKQPKIRYSMVGCL